AAPASPPSAAAGVVWGRFVGRAEELGTLKAAIDAALGGRGSLVLVGGEPGIGKTRLVEEAGVYAKLRGARVLVGRCFEEEAALPDLPFVEGRRRGRRGGARWGPRPGSWGRGRRGGRNGCRGCRNGYQRHGSPHSCPRNRSATASSRACAACCSAQRRRRRSCSSSTISIGPI